VEARLHRAQRTADDEGDLLEWGAIDVVEGEDGPMVEREPAGADRVSRLAPHLVHGWLPVVGFDRRQLQARALVRRTK